MSLMRSHPPSVDSTPRNACRMLTTARDSKADLTVPPPPAFEYSISLRLAVKAWLLRCLSQQCLGL